MSTRIPPHPAAADGSPAPELLPPCAGRWLRDADGGLTPADEQTAQAAGLDWPAAADADAIPSTPSDAQEA